MISSVDAFTARDLMKPLPKCLEQGASVREATVFLINNQITAAPVVNSSGRVIGVVTLTHILSAQRGIALVAGSPFAWDKYAASRLDYFERTDLALPAIDPANLEPQVGNITVGDVMSYDLFAVNEDAPIADVVNTMLRERVHRIFVADSSAAVIGIVSAYDILAALVRGVDVVAQH